MEHDVIVIGGGPAGEVLAGRLGEEGLDVVLVEGELIGGECSYWACMPSKALLRPGELVAEVARVRGVRPTELDPAAVLARRDEVIHHLDDSSQLPWLEDRGVKLVRGHGVIAGERRVVVDGEELTARGSVVVATGTGPLMPPIPGLATASPWTNRDGTTLKDVPESLVILGGGVVGVELAQAWASLGTRVRVVERRPRLIAREEPFASEQVQAALEELGVEIRTGTPAVGVRREEAGGEVTVELDDGTEVSGAELLVAVGRSPRTDDIGLETIGLEPGKPIEVGDDLRSSAHNWLYAVGDVNGRALLTHMGKYQARIAADVIVGKGGRIEVDGALSPRVIFTDPQVAAVGHTLASAEEAGLEPRALDASTSGTAGASFVGRNAPGTTRLVVDGDDRLRGATFTGPEVAEMVHAATVAIACEATLAQLRHAIPSFPTRSEVWLNLLAQA